MALLSNEDREYLKNLYKDMKKDVNILFSERMIRIFV